MKCVYDKETDAIYISATNLIEFVYRGGNIESRMLPGNKNGSALVTHKLHTKKPNIVDAYTFTTIIDGLKITIYTYPESVRHDEKHGYVVEKVVPVPYRLQGLENGELEISLKSAMISAYIIMEKFKQLSVKTNVTFYQEGGDEMREYSRVIERPELISVFERAINLALPFFKIIKQRSLQTVDELKELRFPFKEGAREGQKEFIVEAFKAIHTRKRLVAEAPTGTGKTIASLYPALKSLGEGKGDKIFYFTGKTTTALSALNAIDIMRDQIPNLRSIHISSKDKCCVSFPPFARRKCEPKHCHVTRAYFDKINEALLELLTNYRTYTKDIIDEISAKYSVCSYELSLELSEWCELIVCDYNYLFDLNAYFRRYFECPSDAEFIFLIDEAHNLPDRAREMYSATLSRSELLNLASIYSADKFIGEPFAEILNRFDMYYELAMAEKREVEGEACGFYINTQIEDDFSEPFVRLIKGIKKLFNRDHDDDELHKLFMNVKKFVSVADIFDKRFTFFVEAHGEDVSISLMCLDPSFMLDCCMKKGVSTILFSATLTPLEYFSDILGCAKSSTITLKSPFEKERLCLVGVNNVSTRYEDREKSASTIANIIRAAIEGKQGNYIVYFPSYAYLTSVAEIFEKKYPKIKVTYQKKSMSEKAKKEFLDSFDEKKEGTMVGFCVLGGSFSEGIDLRGERLIGAIIVGVGLPTISSELNIIKEYYDKTRENGYAYAYTYPGMIKVLQAAGRVIRSEDEKGVVFLVDDRFATPEYHQLLPEHWKHIKYINNAKDLLKEVIEFWKK
ncbi:MAG: ATP-dependent DNA helicase [Clostridia bacterium]|nr:ATP-dependent DNA helicase [Clostridia bacterium]